MTLDLSPAWTRTQEIARGLLLAVPSVIVGLLVFGGFLLLGVALSVALPSFQPGDVVQVLGIGSVAIGFAFCDILQDFLAGILLLITQPFRIGDQIVAKGHEGTVEDIQTRATSIRTYDGLRVVIPNGDLFSDTVVVNTALPQRRAPEVLVMELAGSSVNLRARWWLAPPQKADALDARDRVLTAIKSLLTAEGIDLPFPTQQVLWHDQTEATDGDRIRQREGWPAGSGPSPGPRRSALVRHATVGDASPENPTS